MDFEYDPNKSEANKAKHGIDFEEAQELWNDQEAATSPRTGLPGSCLSKAACGESSIPFGAIAFG
jgi:hypothetical protein